MSTWVQIEDALHAWVSAASGVPVVWAEQTGARPPVTAFATLRLGDMRQVGAVDDVVHNYDALRASGSEIALEVRSLREFTVGVQLFAATDVGSSNARALAQRTQSALYLPSAREALAAVGVSPFDPGVIQTLNRLVGTRFESRALFEVRCYVEMTLSEFTTWIEHCSPVSYLGPPGLGTRDLIDI